MNRRGFIKGAGAVAAAAAALPAAALASGPEAAPMFAGMEFGAGPAMTFYRFTLSGAFRSFDLVRVNDELCRVTHVVENPNGTSSVTVTPDFSHYFAEEKGVA
jgi:DMSO/TMAO reductase YedYZ molybdopterin-dependent catalytic subunit